MSFTYRWRAVSYGTTWYHSHFTLQYSDGLVGPIVINGPTSAEWDVDLGPVLITDWYHTVFSLLWFQEETNPPVASDNQLINGKGMNGTLGSFQTFSFQQGKKFRLRIINTSSDQHLKFSIDQHVMTVMAADFIPIEPYQQTVLNVAIGQRYDVVVEANQPVGNYFMRAVPALDCSATNHPEGGFAIVSYEGAGTDTPTSTPYIISPKCGDETEIVPIVHVDAGPFAYGEQENLNLTLIDNFLRFTLNNSTLVVDWSEPTLLLAENLNSSFPGNYNALELNGTDQTVPPVRYTLTVVGLFGRAIGGGHCASSSCTAILCTLI
jgi:FtsP/CotA-like multicopper oxidase with cupredoxin domain